VFIPTVLGPKEDGWALGLVSDYEVGRKPTFRLHVRQTMWQKWLGVTVEPSDSAFPRFLHQARVPL
jgi:hypothetical protein